MIKKAIFRVEENEHIARDTHRMVLAGPTEALVAPGQFVNIQLEGFFLRRPISVCDWDEERMTLVYKIMGRGTARMAQYAPGTQLDLLLGLGNGFSLPEGLGKPPVALVGGGCGLPPLYALAKALIYAGVIPKVVMGFRAAADVFYEEEFKKLGCEVVVTTEDGSAGVKGYVTDALRDMTYGYYYACGPQGMLQAVHALGKEKNAEGQLSFEERMGCGFGACMGCSCETLVGPKRVCVDGPVFPSREVMFE